MITNEEFFSVLETILRDTDLTCYIEEKQIESFNEKLEKMKESSPKAVEITEKGYKILAYMQQDEEKFNNVFTAAGIGEHIFLSGRSVSGSMKKLVDNGYCSKTKGSPTCYHLNDKGRAVEIIEK